jgi:hypothetical protein
MTQSTTLTSRRPISVTRGQFGFKVCPAQFPVNVDLGLGPDFRLLNHSGQDMRVSFPAGLVIDVETGRPVVAPFVLGDRGRKDLRVNLDFRPLEPQVSEVYSYEVFMMRAEIEASGCSRPNVEIQR